MMCAASRVLIGLCVVVGLLLPAHAVQPNEVLPDPALEQRARQLSAQLRCLVCQNQSIDDSDAELARDLRVLVRERLVAGDSDAQVMDFVVARYGEFVLLNPRMSARNAALWITPLLVLIGGGLYLVVSARRRRLATAATMTEEERAALRRVQAGE